jgi:hypothetical protein
MSSATALSWRTGIVIRWWGFVTRAIDMRTVSQSWSGVMLP